MMIEQHKDRSRRPLPRERHDPGDRSKPLSTMGAVALYVGALLGPSLLMVPGLAAQVAGPASLLAWLGLLAASALLARVFAALGVRVPSGGVAAYTAAGLGDRAGRAVQWCFLAGAVAGAPIVCLIGGTYVAAALHAGRLGAVLAAMVLLAAVVILTIVGARTGSRMQLILVVALIVLVAVAVIGSAHQARAAEWTPFAPHGLFAVGPAAVIVMLSIVGWEAIAPMTSRLADPTHQLPRVIGAAFIVTSLLCLTVVVTVVSVLGTHAGNAPLAALMQIAVGTAGPALAAALAVAVTLASTTAYLSGAAAMLADLRRPTSQASHTVSLPLGVGVLGVLILLAVGAGVVTTADLVDLPTSLFLTVYLGCTVAATRLLSRGVRIAAILCVGVVALVLAFSGWSLLAPAAVIIATWLWGSRRGHRQTPPTRNWADPPAGVDREPALNADVQILS